MLKPSLIQEFKTVVGADNVFTDDADLMTYSYDAAVVKPVIPALVARPTDSDALGRVVKLCGDNGLSA